VIGPLDTGLEFYRQVLNLRADRQQLLTADIANAMQTMFNMAVASAHLTQ